MPLTYDQFKYGFANTLDDDEANELYEKYSVPGAGKVLFQAASANPNPWTEDKVDTENPRRGPMLILAGEKDHTVPHAIANASFKRERRNDGVTEIVEIEGRGHSLTIDSGWRDVCDKALAFVKQFAEPSATKPVTAELPARPAPGEIGDQDQGSSGEIPTRSRGVAVALRSGRDHQAEGRALRERVPTWGATPARSAANHLREREGGVTPRLTSDVLLANLESARRRPLGRGDGSARSCALA